MAHYVYVTGFESDEISVFTMDPASGELTHQRDVAVSGKPAPLAISPDKGTLHVGRRGIPEISSYAIDHSTGDLTFVSTVALEFDPCFLSTDRKGRYLLSSYYEGARVMVHPIGGDGGVQDPPVQNLSTGIGAHSIQADPTNKFVFVPHISGRGTQSDYAVPVGRGYRATDAQHAASRFAAEPGGAEAFHLSPAPGRDLLFERAGLQRDGVCAGRWGWGVDAVPDHLDAARGVRRAELLRPNPD